MTGGESEGAGTSEVQAPTAVRRRVYAFCLVIALAVLAADQVTKVLAVRGLEGREPVRILGGAVYLMLTRNSGAAFSIATDYTAIFPVIAIVVSVGILWVMRSVLSVPWAVALGLGLGGTVGNLADRIFRAPGPFVGHVVDFISVFDAHGMGFPVFNVADSALCVGVGLAILLELTGRSRDGTRQGVRQRPSDQVAAAGMPDSDRDTV